MPVLVLSIVDGDQVPLIPFVEAAGSVGAAEPLHIGAIVVNVGVMLVLTVTVAVVVVAH